MAHDEQVVLGMARAVFMNRLHLLRLTEIVRLQIRPKDDGIMSLPPELDHQMVEQAFNFVLTCFPTEYHAQIHQARRAWLELH
ncbi:MAG TPA: hypothetical protein VGQ83_07025 [Polyangia bacterium]|jgi:hypothetical protein